MKVIKSSKKTGFKFIDWADIKVGEFFAFYPSLDKKIDGEHIRLKISDSAYVGYGRGFLYYPPTPVSAEQLKGCGSFVKIDPETLEIAYAAQKA